MGIRIVGVDKVLANLNKEIRAIEGRLVRRGMFQAGNLIRRESIKLTPVDTGNLRSSAFVRVNMRRGRPTAIVGYSAAYAAFVHERTHTKGGKKIKFKASRASAKFLERALFANKKKILAILARSARIDEE